MSKPGLLVVFSSPSGGGKTTLRSRVCEIFPDLRYSISMTTRAPRPYEVDGVDYHFVSQKEFLERRDQGEFIEWAKVHNNYYGTLFPYVHDMLEEGHNVILDIDTQGAAIIKNKVPNGVFIFILPPSLETLAKRLLDREKKEDEVIRQRLNKAHDEIAHIYQYDYVVVNKDIDSATEILKHILISERWRTSRLDIQKIINSEDFEFLLDNS